ncbi:hypothetical protein FF80_01385 [Devosia sp. LC5]|uniref:hypothetical protein n=1 Tax=Devosia sp. LC5 TaxID=1502724 RepID=UPI0004E3DC48|nr:hypothetical protein [Devosia sp. LC5]KFC69117.1 hypothetical protein FF80_01385 [Devosia sp. LC5]
MVTAIALEPIGPSHTNITDYRHRAAPGERTVLPHGTPSAPKNARPNQEREERSSDSEQEAPARDSSAMFAAAVIAGALAPTPQTLAELYQRIGSSTIPPESMARLKDLMA